MSVPDSQSTTRYLVKSTFGAGRDFTVLDMQTQQQLYRVDRHIGPRPRAEVLDREGRALYVVRGTLLGIPKRLTIADAHGTEVASLSGKFFSPIRSRMTLRTSDGDAWDVSGSILEKEYSVSRSGTPVVHISQRWVTIRDTYTIDVHDGADPALALAIMWAVDRWVERD